MHLSGKIFLTCTFLLTVVLCKKNSASGNGAAFDSIPQPTALNPLIREVSGIADSHVHPGLLWAEEDSGNPSQLYLISHNGQLLKKVFLKGITNRDWEDMCLVKGYIYLAETGDNSAVYPSYKFYRFPEPENADTINNIQTIGFSYADGSHDAEAFLVDGNSGDIFIITKRDNPSRVYKLSQPSGINNTAGPVGTMPFSGVVSATLSSDGKDILVKTYTAVYYFSRKQGESIDDALARSPVKVGYVSEPQGEAICFANDNSGFFTLSEQAWASSLNINFYRRIK